MFIENLINNCTLPVEKRVDNGLVAYDINKAPEGAAVLESHFHGGDYIVLAEGGWRLNAVSLGASPWSHDYSSKVAVTLGSGDIVLATSVDTFPVLYRNVDPRLWRKLLGWEWSDSSDFTRFLLAEAIIDVKRGFTPNRHVVKELRWLSEFFDDKPLLERLS